MAKKKKKKSKTKKQKVELETPPVESGGTADKGEPRPKMRRKEFEKALEPLQVGLVKLQEWGKYRERDWLYNFVPEEY